MRGFCLFFVCCFCEQLSAAAFPFLGDVPPSFLMEGVLGRSVEVEPRALCWVQAEGGRLKGEVVVDGAPSGLVSALGNFLVSLFSGDGQSSGGVFELRSAGGVDARFWLDVGFFSSMSEDSYGRFSSSLSPFFGYLWGSEFSGVSVSEGASLLSGVLGGSDSRGLSAGVSALSGLLGSLTPGGLDRVRVDRRYWYFRKSLDSFSWFEGLVFVVDPSPFEGPDARSYLVVLGYRGYE